MGRRPFLPFQSGAAPTPKALTRRDLLRMALPSALALAGCTDAHLPPPRRFGAGSATPRRGGTLRFSITGEVATLDPANAFDVFAIDAMNLLHDTLLGYPPSTAQSPMEPIPELASRWSCSADGRVYTFHLREGARFSSGEPVLAEDFVYALDRLLDPALGSSATGLLRGVSGAEERLAGKASHVAGIRAVDAKTLEIRLLEPDPSFLYVLTMRFTAPLKKRHVEAMGPQLRTKPLGTGPFVLRAFEEGRRIVYEQNPLYWNRERIWLDRIVTDLLVPVDAAALRFLRGEYDTLHQPTPDDYLRFASSPAWTPYLDRKVVMATDAFMLNTRKAPFSDKRVRRAMNHAIDKQALARLVNGREVVARGYLPPGIPGHDPHREPYPHDPERARRLLAEAGFPDGFDMTFINTKLSSADPWGESIQADLEAVGIRAKITYLGFSAIWNAVCTGEYDMTWFQWMMDFPAPWNFLESNFHSRMIPPGGYDTSHYENPEFDRLLDQARRELDEQTRIALYRRAEDILYDDCPAIWVGHPIQAEVRMPYVRGYGLHPCRWRSYRDTWLDEPITEAP